MSRITRKKFGWFAMVFSTQIFVVSMILIGRGQCVEGCASTVSTSAGEAGLIAAALWFLIGGIVLISKD